MFRPIALSLFALCFLASPASSLAKDDSSKKKLTWQQKCDRAHDRLTRKGVMKARAIAKSRLGKGHDDEAYWRLCRSNHWLYDHARTDAKKIQWAQEGIKFAEKGIKANSKSAGCHYYYAVCLGLYSQHFQLKALLGNVSKMIAMGKKAVRLDPKFDDAGPHRLLGFIYLEAPGFLGGDTKKAVFHFQSAVLIAPKLAYNLIGLARAYIEDDQEEAARAILKRIIKGRKFLDDNTGILKFKRQARKLLKDL